MASPLYYSCATDGGDADATSHAVEYEYEVRTSPGDVDRAAGEVRRLLAERAAAAAGLAGCADAGAGRRKRRLGAQGGQRGPPSPRRLLRPGGRGSTPVVAVSSPSPDAVEEGVPCAILGATESATDESDGGARSEDAGDGPDGWDEHEIEAVVRVDGSPPVVTRRKKRKRTGGRTAADRGGSDRSGGGFEAHMGHVARTGGRGGEPVDSPGYAYNYASTRDVPLDRSSRTGHNPIDPPAAFAERRSDDGDAPGKTLSFRARSVDPATVVRPRSSLVCAVVRGSLTVYSSGDTGGYAGSNLGERVLHSLVSDVNGRGMRPAGGSVAELRMVIPARPSRSGSVAGAAGAVEPSESGGASSPYLYPLIGLAALAVLLAGLFVKTGRRGRSETGPLESHLRDAKAHDPANKDGDDGGTDCGTVCDVSDDRDGVVTTTTTRSHLVPAEGQGWIQGGLSDLAEYAGWVVRSLTRDAEDDDREVEEARARDGDAAGDRAGSEPPPGTRWRTDAEKGGEAGPSHGSQTAPTNDGGGQDGLPPGKNARRSSFLGALFPPPRRRDDGGDDARAAAAASGRYYDITSRSRCPTPTNGYGQEVDSAYFFGTSGNGGGGRDDDRVGLVSGGRGGGGVRAALGRSMGWLGSRSFGGGGDGDDDDDGGGYGTDGSDFSVDLDVREVRSVQPPAPPRGASAASPAPPSGGRGRPPAGRRRRDLASPLSVERGSGSAVVASPDVAAAAEPSPASPVTVPGDQPSLASPLTVPWDEAGTVLSSAYDACDVGGAFAAYDGVACDMAGFVNWFRGGK